LAAAEKVAQILPTLDVEGFLYWSANLIDGSTNLAGMLAEQIERSTGVGIRKTLRNAAVLRHRHPGVH
jgi:hypothetical protein